MTDLSTITIVGAMPSDAQSIVTMHAKSWLDTYPNEAAGVSREWVEERVKNWSSSEKMAGRIEKIERARHDPDILYRVAKDNKGKIVGLIMPHRDSETQRVGAIYIDKAYYGTVSPSGLWTKLLPGPIKNARSSSKSQHTINGRRRFIVNMGLMKFLDRSISTKRFP